MKLHLYRDKEYPWVWSMLTREKMAYYVQRLEQFCKEYDIDIGDDLGLTEAEIMQDFASKSRPTIFAYFYVEPN